MNIRDTLAIWGINAVALAGGFIGTLVALSMNDKQQSFRGAVAQLVCGIAFSGYGSTVMVQIFSLTSPGWIGLMGLILGLLGMYIVRGLINLGKNFEKDPIETIKNIRSSKKSDSDVDSN